MAKTSVNTIVSKLKLRLDYNVSDDDLDTLLIGCINDALKLIFQWLSDAGSYNDISASDGTNIKTTDSQAYIDISTHLAAMDELIALSERTNDKRIEIIPYREFIKLYPDPTANESATPDHAALWAERLYLGPTPSADDLVIYVEYTEIPTDVAAGDTLPYKTKYDPLLIAQARVEYLQFFDANNINAITLAQGIADRLKNDLITAAARNVGMNRQTASRRDGAWIGPRSPTDPGDIGP